MENGIDSVNSSPYRRCLRPCRGEEELPTSGPRMLGQTGNLTRCWRKTRVEPRLSNCGCCEDMGNEALTGASLGPTKRHVRYELQVARALVGRASEAWKGMGREVSGIIDVQWARDAVAIVERAVSELREAYPRSGPMAVKWGHPDPELAQMESEMSPDSRNQYGQLHHHDLDISIEIGKHGDSDFPNPMHIRTSFGAPQRLPLEARDVFNVLSCCQDGVSLSLMPDVAESAVLVSGVTTLLAVEVLNGRVLHDALFRVAVSHEGVLDRLAHDKGDDHWAMSAALT